MRKQTALAIVILGLGLGTALSVPTASPGDQARISQLITQLGSPSYRGRDAAKKELDAIGEPALAALRQAAKSADMEVANSATILAVRIESRIENARLLAPTLVELSLRETPIEQAVAELAKKSGYPIVIAGDKSKLVSRMITLETGKVPFWKALEMLCAKAELVESDLAVGVGTPPLPTPVQIQPLPPLPVPAPRLQLQPNIAPPMREVPRLQFQPKIAPPEKVVPQKELPPQGFSADVPQAAPKDVMPPQPQPVQIQVQIQAAPPRQVIMQPVPIGLPVPEQVKAGPIVLVDGKADMSPSWVEGAIRVRAVSDSPLANPAPAATDEIRLPLQIACEPKILLQQVLGVKIDRALDNNDQNLVELVKANNLEFARMPPIRIVQMQGQQAVLEMAQSPPRSSPVGRTIVLASLKKGEKETKSIKELRGTLALKIRTPIEPIVTIENILKAKGESVKGKSDARLKIVDVQKESNGDIKLEVELQQPHDVQAQAENGNMAMPMGIVIQGNVRIQVGGGGGPGAPVFINNNGQLGLELLDAKGSPLATVQQQVNTQWQQNGRTMNATMTFRPQKDQEAVTLVFKGTRFANIDVPFVLKDVPVK